MDPFSRVELLFVVRFEFYVMYAILGHPTDGLLNPIEFIGNLGSSPLGSSSFLPCACLVSGSSNCSNGNLSKYASVRKSGENSASPHNIDDPDLSVSDLEVEIDRKIVSRRYPESSQVRAPHFVGTSTSDFSDRQAFNFTVR